ncbi:RNA polymerase sigma factor [Actinocorallia longicatena]|uniref:RNA polymerase sigma factor n=1 Tax=Actinocorallia longicatena TaxID=111803 RepID=A0ABP6QM68_9ACTN
MAHHDGRGAVNTGRETDASLAAAVREDPDRFTDVYDRYFDVVHGYIAGRLDTQAADDLAAETFTLAFLHRDRFDPALGALRPWLLGIATNIIARHRRAEARRYRALARSAGPDVQDGHESRVVASVAAKDLQPRLAGALAALSAKERDVVLLMALGELSHEEIGQALGIPYGTVGSRLNRARGKLRAALEEED